MRFIKTPGTFRVSDFLIRNTNMMELSVILEDLRSFKLYPLCIAFSSSGFWHSISMGHIPIKAYCFEFDIFHPFAQASIKSQPQTSK